MDGPSHYREAEQCLDAARRASDNDREDDATFWHREAQVHASLAVAAAVALDDAKRGYRRSDWLSWHEAAGIEPDDGEVTP